MTTKCPLCGKELLLQDDGELECNTRDCTVYGSTLSHSDVESLTKQINSIKAKARADERKKILKAVFDFIENDEYFAHGEGEYEEFEERIATFRKELEKEVDVE